MGEFVCLAVVLVPLVGFFIWEAFVMKKPNPYIPTTESNSSPSVVTPAPRRSSPRPGPTTADALSSLPAIYYVLAVFCGLVLMGLTVVSFENFSVVETGAWVGYTVGSVLSMLAVGRVIQLLQQIRDAVRS